MKKPDYDAKKVYIKDKYTYIIRSNSHQWKRASFVP